MPAVAAETAPPVIDFNATNYRLVHQVGGERRFELSAARLEMHQRHGRFVSFPDHTELYLTGVVLRQPVAGEPVAFDAAELNRLAGQVQPAGAALSAPTPAAAARPARRSLVGRVSRIVADDVRVEFQPRAGEPVRLTAGHAQMPVDGDVIRFDHQVAITAGKCRLRAPSAIWSGSEQGFFIAEAHRLNRRAQNRPAFYQIYSRNGCVATRPTQPVAYSDPLDLVEYQIVNKLPLEIRMLFGLFGSGERF